MPQCEFTPLEPAIHPGTSGGRRNGLATLDLYQSIAEWVSHMHDSPPEMACTGLMNRVPLPGQINHISRTRSTSVDIARAVLAGLGSVGQLMPDAATLCQIAGVSERSLQIAFNEVYGEPPSVHLRRRALHTVRRVLQLSDAASTTVSAVALDHGFTHLGRFARYYKEEFGELPSETLRRDPTPTQRPTVSPGPGFA